MTHSRPDPTTSSASPDRDLAEASPRPVLCPELREELAARYARFLDSSPALAAPFVDGLEEETDPYLIAGLQFLLVTLPPEDLLNHDYAGFRELVADSLRRRDEMPWADRVTDTCYLLYVLYPRSGNEDADQARLVLAEELLPKVQGLSMREAILEVNLWAFSRATYRATDRRTASPLTVIRRSFGRCGEESSLVVAALRAIGIPARQIYTPRWAHSDDNHAWVEAMAEDGWHYLGACEPEAVLDRGWFTAPAARSALVLAQSPSDLRAPGDLYIEQAASGPGRINRTPDYAPTGTVTARVTEADGTPVEGADLSFAVINYAEVAPLIRLLTDTDGRASLALGLGDYLVTATADGRYGEAVVRNRADGTEVTVTLGEAPEVAPSEDALLDGQRPYFRDTDLHLQAPPPRATELPAIDDAAAEAHEAKVREMEAIRDATRARFVRSEDTLEGEKDMGDIAPEGDDPKSETAMLAAAFGNADTLRHFLDREDLDASREDRLTLLRTLRFKDYSDVTSDLLAHHLRGAQPLEDDPIFRRYVLCPRLDWEPLFAWRDLATTMLDASTRESLRENPAALYPWLEARVSLVVPRRRTLLYARPEATLRVGKAAPLSRDILYVALARSLRIPARLNPGDRRLEYYHDGVWHRAAPETPDADTPAEPATLHLVHADGQDALRYGAQWTLARWTGNGWQTLGYYGQTLDAGHSPLTLSLMPGTYRLVLAVRSDRGDVDVRLRAFTLQAGGEQSLEAALPEQKARASVHLTADRLPAGRPLKIDGDPAASRPTVPEPAAEASSAPTDEGLRVRIVLDPGKEPSEHIMNELLARRYAIEDEQARYLLLFPDDAELTAPTLRRLLLTFDAMPVARLAGAPEDALGHIPGLPAALPYVLVTDGDGRVIFSASGYQVGTVDQMLRAMG